MPTLRCRTCNTPYVGKRLGRCPVCTNEHARQQRAQERFKLRQDVLKAYGGKCQCPGGCEIKEFEFLVLDHIFDDGFRHRKKTGGAGYHTYRDVKRQGFPKDKYRILCQNCNSAREFFGECPHVYAKQRREGLQVAQESYANQSTS